MASPLSEQLGRYAIFLKSVGPSGVHEYVDVRVKGRIIYK
jgi:hypothetical protein